MIVPSMVELQQKAASVRETIAAFGPLPQLALYGAGFLGNWAAAWLPRNGFELTACFDGNPARIGSTIGRIPVLAPNDLGLNAVDLVLITARHAVGAVSALLQQREIRHMPFEAFVVALNFARFAEIHNLLSDERSCEVLRAVLTAMLTGDNRICEAVFEKDQYFCLPRFCGAEKEVFVDAGAYVGDSIERFIWTHYGVFEAIHAFEPGARQFEALKLRCDRLAREWAIAPSTMSINPCGLSRKDGVMAGGSQSGQLQSLALAERSGEGSDAGQVAVTTLDHYFEGRKATLIKADVEGMELALLDGARDTITRHRPKLAICAYHYTTDIPDIVEYLHSLVPDYQFALRHHSPQLMETVLYAWVG